MDELKIKNILLRYLNYTNKPFSNSPTCSQDILNVVNLINSREGYYICFKSNPFTIKQYKEAKYFHLDLKKYTSQKTIYFAKCMRRELIYKLPELFKDGYIDKELEIYNNFINKKKIRDEFHNWT